MKKQKGKAHDKRDRNLISKVDCKFQASKRTKFIAINQIFLN